MARQVHRTARKIDSDSRRCPARTHEETPLEKARRLRDVAQARYDIAVGDPKRIPSSKPGPDYWESPLPHKPRPIQR